MAAIVQTLQGTTYTFQLQEADIATLTYRSQWPSPSTDFNAVAAAIRFDPLAFGESTPTGSFFQALLAVHGAGDYFFTLPTGKPLLPAIAQRLADAETAYPVPVMAVLTFALRGGGMTLAAAASAADQLSRLNISGAAGKTWVQSVLVPQILNAAAAA